MSSKANIEAANAWSYFQSIKGELADSMRQIASNDEFGVEIFITNDSGFPCFIVTADSVQVYEGTAKNEEECKNLTERVFENYLTDKAVEYLCEDVTEDQSDFDEDDMISEREDELDLAILEFVSVVLEDYVAARDIKGFDAVCEDLKEHFLEYMARKHGLIIRRPMFLEYEDGEEVLEQYPYEHIVFDDEDNPIYKQTE